MSANARPGARRRGALAAALGAMLMALAPGGTVHAAGAPPAACAAVDEEAIRPVMNVRIDNDMFGGLGQDQGYSNGFQLTLMSANLKEFGDPACLPTPVRWVDRYLTWMHPRGLDQKNVVVGFGQALFTPADREATGLLPDDRPYAAALLLTVGYNARSGDRLQTSHLRVGIVGPSALGEQTQNGWHGIWGIDEFRGWDNQLRDEPVFQLVHERMRRWAPPPADRLSWDAIGHWGASLGNLLTYANAGLEVRIGSRLPDDFGSDPLRPAGENTAPTRRTPPDEWSWHAFASVDVRAVAHNITLDGNLWKDSHSVQKRTFVADFGRGIAITYGPWKLALAHYNRTREFDGQRVRPAFGSITVSRRF